MNDGAAREIIAAYLSGQRHVESTEIEAAIKIINQADRYVQDLKRLLGVSTAGLCECHHLQSRMAELAGMPLDQARIEFPALAGHLSLCHSCKEDFWEIRSPWEPATASLSHQAARLRRRLAAAIQVVFGGGGLRELGFTLPSAPLIPVAATADEVGVSFGEAREWRLADAETGSEIRLLLRAAVGGEFWLECSFKSSSAGRPRLTITGLPGQQVVVSGALALFASEPIKIKAGSYLLTIELAGTESRAWEIPLELVVEPDPAP
jgi:hypothetical protein